MEVCFILGVWMLPLISARAAAPSFNVQAILPESQTKKDISYFDLVLEPNQVETLEIEVENSSTQPMELTISANTAITNRNGVIDYGVADREPDSSLKISFSEIALIKDDTIKLEAQESKRIPIVVTLPDTPFNGIILGGISVSEKLNEEPKTDQVTNRFSYTLAVVIAQNETELGSELKLRDVQVEQRNRRNVIVASVQNPIAKIMNHVEIKAKVFKGNQTDPLYYSTQSEMRMAPNSTLDFGIATNDQRLKAGKYRLEMNVVSGEEQWDFEKSFEIKDQQARDLNETAVNLASDSTTLFLWIALGSMLALLGILVSVVLVKKRKGEQNEL